MPGNPLTDDRWAQEVTDQIITLVGKVRDNTTDRAIKVTRLIVWGLFAAVLGLVLAVVVLIMLTRGIQVLLSFLVSDARAVYISYLVLGTVFVAIGALFMKLRKRKS